AFEIKKKLAEKHPNIHLPELGLIQDVLGEFYEYMERFDKAEEFYLNALEIYKSLLNTKPEEYQPQIDSIKKILKTVKKQKKKYKKLTH
ncbi:MAG: tetratricopeptide repeat protein, partial [Candidatus Lokiarchaeota archaeon]|nr:tetratricopeptide repeat protein [Candidatus Lokiarchaeota archaeon]